MNIRQTIYENLTPQERVIASFEALARQDEKEKQRLIKSCPKKHYSMNDPAYTDTMDAIEDLAMAVEADLRSCILTFFWQRWFKDHEAGERHKHLEEAIQDTPSSITEMLCIKQAWAELLSEQGIDPTVMTKIYEDQCHFGHKWMSEAAEDMDLKPDAETVEKYKTALRDYLNHAVQT